MTQSSLRLYPTSPQTRAFQKHRVMTIACRLPISILHEKKPEFYFNTTNSADNPKNIPEDPGFGQLPSPRGAHSGPPDKAE